MRYIPRYYIGSYSVDCKSLLLMYFEESISTEGLTSVRPTANII